MTNCCVISCSNSYYKLQRWLQSSCDEHETLKEHCPCVRPFLFIAFPTEKTDPDARRTWIRNVNRVDNIGKNVWTPKIHTRICSAHFADGCPTKENPYPTQHMGHGDVKNSRKPPKPRLLISQNKQVTVAVPVIGSVKQTESEVNNIIINDHNYQFNYKCDCSPNCDCVGCVRKELKIKHLKTHIELLQEKVHILEMDNLTASKSFSLNVFTQCDNNVRHYLGLPNRNTFLKLVKLVKLKVKHLRYWKGAKRVISTKATKGGNTSLKKRGPERKLNISQELTILFLKLRLNLTQFFISDLFGISQTLCSQIITTWLKVLSKLFHSLIFHPSKEQTQSCLPKSFQELVPTARSIIDCSEFFIETPNSLDVQANTWSDYKQHNTVKCLVDITPTGSIQFISRSWAGRTSDKTIVLLSGWLDTIEAGDTVLADRGFPIEEELILRHARLYIPPGARGVDQMSREKVMKTKTIANLRIHVERAINRLKWFRILSDTMPNSLVPLMDDILIICAAATNLFPPLVK